MSSRGKARGDQQRDQDLMPPAAVMEYLHLQEKYNSERRDADFWRMKYEALRRCVPEDAKMIADDRTADLQSEIEYLVERDAPIVTAARRLEAWLSANAGASSEFAVHLHVDNVGDADQLAALLTDLTAACKAYGKKTTATP